MKSVVQKTVLVVVLLLATTFTPPVGAQSSANEISSSSLQSLLQKLDTLAAVNSGKENLSGIESLLDSLGVFQLSFESGSRLVKLLWEKAEEDARSRLQSEIYWQAAEIVARKKNDNTNLAEVFISRATLYSERNEFQLAMENYRRAIEILKPQSNLKSQSRLVVLYANAGEIAAYLQNPEDAATFFDEGWLTLTGIKNWREFASSDKETVNKILLGQSASAQRKGDYKLAEEKVIAALSFTDQNSYEAADAFWLIGKVKREQGEFSQAAAYLENGLSIIGRYSDKDAVYLKANLLNSLGLLLLEQRSAKTAQTKLKQALEISRQLKEADLEGTILRNLSLAARQENDFVSSQRYAETALKIAVENKFDDLYISTNNILASLMQKAGKYLEATVLLEKSINLAEKTNNQMRVVESKWHLSESLLHLQNYTEAEKMTRETLAVATERKWSNLIYLSATLLGRALTKENKPREAETAFQLAIKETEQKRSSVAGAEIEKISFMGDKATAYRELLKIKADAGETDQALLISEKLKSRVLEEKLSDLKRQKTNENGFDLPPVNMPSNTAIVSFALTDEKCFAFVLRPGKQPKMFIIAANETALLEKTQRWRESLTSFDPSFKTESKELYNLLFKNLESELSSATNLVVIPDGFLWELPFQALITNEQKYLAETFAVSYAPSLKFFNRLQEKPFSLKQDKILAFANSVTKKSGIVPLPAAEREAAEIGKNYTQPQIFTRGAATETRFKQNASQARLIHLAVHGELDANDPFDSALLFTPTTADDGRLIVSEILQMNLPQSLVVLSSCDTSNGQAINGEGLLSLSWAFLASGGRTIIAAQWAVEEKATAELMQNFYRELNKGENGTPSALALQAAQKESIGKPAPFNHPFYWAGFVAVGDSR